MIKDKNILLGVTGGIAAYKSADLVSRLKKQGANVKVVMTEAATKFISPIVFQTLSNNPVYVDMFHPLSNMDVEHISLAKWADLIVIAPATANTIAKLTHGIADNMLTTVLQAARCPIAIAPAMNTEMYHQEVCQKNIEILKGRGVEFYNPSSGLLACGDLGEGKMMEPELIVEHIDYSLTPKTLVNKKILVTAGPTIESIDPVRYLTNHSSGKMGYSIAIEARNRGAEVTLVSGPTNLTAPWGMEVVPVHSTQEMFDAVNDRFDYVDILFKAAAPSDYRPAHYSDQKIKKKDSDELTLSFSPNPDIAKAMGQKKREQLIIGFAAESENLLKNAQGKLNAKNFDMIVVNDITEQDAGFKADTNRVNFINRSGEIEPQELMLKSELSALILDRVEKLLKARS